MCDTLLLKFMQFIYRKPWVKWPGHGTVRLGMGSAIRLLPNYVPPMACYEVTFSFLCSVKEISTMLSFTHNSTTSTDPNDSRGNSSVLYSIMSSLDLRQDINCSEVFVVFFTTPDTTTASFSSSFTYHTTT